MLYSNMLSIEDQEIYKRIEELIGKSRKLGSNLVIKSFAGAGTSFILKSYAKKHPEVAYISEENMNLGEYSVIDAPIEVALSYLKKADLKQKMAIVFGSGNDYYSEEGREIRLHTYLSGAIGARSKADTEILVKEINGDLKKDRVEDIFKLSGGIGKIAKFLAVSEDKELGQQEILEATKESLEAYLMSDLEELGIIKDGLVVSEMLRGVWDKVKEEIKIDINFDLSWEENGVRAIENLTEVEAKIIRTMLVNGGTVSKEQVSDIKWGVGKYDEYSDQAINKTMRRLDQKMKLYRIKTIPKVGFLIEKR